MAVRLFTCSNCGHKLRLGVDSCGYCRKSTPILNRSSVLAILAAVIVIVAYTAIALAFA
jgi:hypothetical protein